MTIRLIIAVALLSVAGCGIDGPPLPPDGAVGPVVVKGTDLTPEKGRI